MRISINPMPALIAARITKVNENWSAIAAVNLQRDMAHAMKRQWALTLDGQLAPEAELRGITVAELAALILSKPNGQAARELQRQQIMARIEACTTPAELDAL